LTTAARYSAAVKPIGFLDRSKETIPGRAVDS
jgi:hypothetical protein